MCGILGFLNKTTPPDWESSFRLALDTMAHRGPDDSGIWWDHQSGIGLGHRRLSILDLSPLGRQPMHSPSERFVITYNGEVYNYLQLKEELQKKGYPFKGGSDTEVLLAGFEAWGVEKTVERSNGMFAYGVWDRTERVLHLVRDRLGIKPLYYGRVMGSFVFASELKALKNVPGFQGEINRDALALLMHLGYIPAPYSIYNGIYKLPPGTILSLRDGQPAGEPQPRPYWSARQVAERLNTDSYHNSLEEAVGDLDALLRDAVKLRMIADVPLGAFLSGGIDSSTVVALMQAQSPRPVKTFSIGFNESEYNEAAHAKRVAKHLGTDHTELYVTPQQARDVIPRLPTLYDEPFGDSSQIPTFLVSELASHHVTVSLSGDGGDELFGGYNRYSYTQNIWKKVSWLPLYGRRFLRQLAISFPHQILDGQPEKLSSLFDRYARPGTTREQVEKFAEVMACRTPEELYNRVRSHWKDTQTLVPGSNEPSTVMSDPQEWTHLPDLPHRLMYLDMRTYLPDDILVKVDRASMGVSLEARVPLLDHRVVEFAWRLPLHFKVQNRNRKWILKQVLYRYVSQELVERPKKGFGVPVDEWLRGPLRDWGEALLDEQRLRAEGYLNPVPIRKYWEEHQTGAQDWSGYLWDILMFQAWLEEDRA